MATVSSSNTIFSVACFDASHRFENYMSLQNKPLVDFLSLNQGFNAGEAGMKMDERDRVRIREKKVLRSRSRWSQNHLRPADPESK